MQRREAVCDSRPAGSHSMAREKHCCLRSSKTIRSAYLLWRRDERCGERRRDDAGAEGRQADGVFGVRLVRQTKLLFVNATVRILLADTTYWVSTRTVSTTSASSVFSLWSSGLRGLRDILIDAERVALLLVPQRSKWLVDGCTMGEGLSGEECGWGYPHRTGESPS